jgi:MerR family mercuric resistance operon transcriptional regulator
MATKQQKSLTIGRVAEQAEVSIDTIRFYEQRGLLPKPARTAAGYRLYTLDTIERLNFIRRSKMLGFTLEEIILLLKLQDTGGAKAEVRAVTRSKLKQIEMKINDLQRMRDVLSDLEHDCAGSGNARACPIIEALSAESSIETEIKTRTSGKGAS